MPDTDVVENVPVTAVRRLVPGEWQLLRQVRLLALGDAPFAFASTVEEERERPDAWWAESVARLAWFVAEDGERLVGLAAGLPPDDDGAWPELISMWVDEAHRGGAVAERLLQMVVDWAEGEGATGLVLGVAEDNERALRFYERAGFRPTGGHEPLRSRPAVCTSEMCLVLSRPGHGGQPPDG